MSTRLVLGVFMLIAFLFGPQQASAVVKGSLSKQKTDYYLDISPEELYNKSVRTLHKESGKTFTLKERMVLRALKNKLKKADPNNLEAAYEEAEMNIFAILGVSAGVVAVPISIMPFLGLLFGPIAMILSLIGLQKIKKSEGKERGRGLSITGLLLGIVALVLGLLWVWVALSW